MITSRLMTYYFILFDFNGGQSMCRFFHSFQERNIIGASNHLPDMWSKMLKFISFRLFIDIYVGHKMKTFFTDLLYF